MAGTRLRQGMSFRASPPAPASIGCSVGVCSTVDLFTGCRGNSALAPGAHPHPLRSLSLTLVVAGLSLTLYSQSSACRTCLPFLQHALTEAPPVLSEGLRCALLRGRRGSGCAWHRAAQAAPHRGRSCSPLLTAPGHTHSIQSLQVTYPKIYTLRHCFAVHDSNIGVLIFRFSRSWY